MFDLVSAQKSFKLRQTKLAEIKSRAAQLAAAFQTSLQKPEAKRKRSQIVKLINQEEVMTAPEIEVDSNTKKQGVIATDMPAELETKQNSKTAEQAETRPEKALSNQADEKDECTSNDKISHHPMRDWTSDQYLGQIQNTGNLCIWWINEADRISAVRMLPKQRKWKEVRMVLLMKLSHLPQGGYISNGTYSLFTYKHNPAECNGIIINLETQNFLKSNGYPGSFAFFK